MGEMYLYAPRSRQPASLCADSQNVCNSEYGISIGRGSFSFKQGEWTQLRQEVRLNTPGEQDGGFVLWVDGAKVLERRDIYYRSAPDSGSDDDGDSEDGDGDGEVSGGLLTGILHQEVKVQWVASPDEIEFVAQPESQPVGFTGLFFSTFFGGHSSEWASPKDQYVWFRSFAIEVKVPAS